MKPPIDRPKGEQLRIRLRVQRLADQIAAGPRGVPFTYADFDKWMDEHAPDVSPLGRRLVLAELPDELLEQAWDQMCEGFISDVVEEAFR